jgi:hypothetical protein
VGEFQAWFRTDSDSLDYLGWLRWPGGYDPGMVFFLGPGLLEISGHAADPPGRSVMIWIQVRDVRAEHARLDAVGVPIIRSSGRPRSSLGLSEIQIEDPDGIRIVLVEVPPVTLSAVTRDQRYG